MDATETLPDIASSIPISDDIVIKVQTQSRHMLSNVPYDIFLMIVFSCWKGGNDDDRSNLPITASHVCRTWRRYALDTGAFWASLEFRQARPHRAIMKYKVWLERARGSPLDIFIGFQPFKGASVKHAKSIMRLIMPHISHWRSFRVDRVPKKISRLIFDRLRNVSAPMLEVLKVFGERHRRIFQGPTTTTCKLKPFINGEASNSNLKELTVVGFPHNYFVTRFTRLQVFQLTQFDFFAAGTIENVKSIQHILLSLPNLHTLHIDCYRPIPENHRSSSSLTTLPTRISHPFLKELWIYLPKADRDAILSSLDLPRVRFFLTRMQVEAAVGLDLLPPLSQYHPFSNLVSLRLSGSYSDFAAWSLNIGTSDPSSQMNLTHLEGALTGLPLLKALTFDQVDFEGGKWLICLGTTCPQLHWLTFTRCGGCTLEQIRTIVEARRKKHGFDALVRLVIEQWSAGNFIKIDQGADEWLKNSLIYEITHTVDNLNRDSYLSVVEKLKPSALLTGINPRSSRR
ncbi:hypothetical protein M407DRAFT_27261 [Tulasnella calospora MUT 4182]|uniref:F-box domain-containing protein n=1 Tax=Tulasnella calospora MUT 4182 TaxID=1051891 RepID=A0A0C3Q3I1_9AGAM|nr:hypothetical protein M407DRAFT_27261 [Tulasnella calospora MUT 4182]